MAREPQGYWEKRQTQLMKEIENSTVDTIDSLIRAYNRATNNINNEIKKIYNKFATDNKLTKEEALKLLSQSDTNQHYKELLEKIKQTTDEEVRQKLLARYNAPAYAYRITRYQALQENIDVELKKLAAFESNVDKIRFTDTLTEGYYRNIYDIQKGLGLAFNFSQIDRNTINTLLKEKWNNEMNYSSRIWNNFEKLSEYLNKTLIGNSLSGKTIQQMSSDLNNAMNVGLFNATRLVRTETNFYANQAELLAYEECGIEKYQFIATLDKVTCKHCASFDKEVIDIKEAKVGYNYPPIHPNDRCTTIAYFDEDSIENLQRRARNPENNKNYKLDKNMSFEEWKKDYGEDKIDLYHKMYVNEKGDKEQYKRYIKALGKIDDIKTFAKFQNLKYNDKEKWKSLKVDYSDSIGIYSEGQAKEYIKNIPLTLREGMQNKHIEGSHNFESGKSVVTITLDEIKTLVEENAGKGIKKFDEITGKWNKKEIVTVEKNIGYVYSDNENKIYTKSFKIHYSKKGYHIVPYIKGDERKDGN